ncbi:hypothetical protein [Rhizobium wuzhouense]|uniref:Uncharacterized protein n=1 Tax=Rhizobium wuzhouense TaxID=1986026 RepID=A0ABX5NN39_9HYPH|nr:hypothetical protein [Rhizobium wuzhouense]PYB71685.1 hypothetical protein DMY87_15840 [Rhizobium wuzhouense]
MNLRTSSWVLLDAGASVRIAGSLADLAQGAGKVERTSLLAAFQGLDPFSAPFEHPFRHLTDCARAARDLASSHEYQLSDRQMQVVISVYEAGLLNGYDAVTNEVPHQEAEGFSPTDAACIYAVAWRHGDAIRRRWRAYGHLVSILIGDRQP